MFTYETQKGELCQIECWADEDREERFEDGDKDLIWIDRHHSNEYGDIANPFDSLNIHGNSNHTTDGVQLGQLSHPLLKFTFLPHIFIPT